MLSDEKFGNLMAAKRNDKKAGVTIVVPKVGHANAIQTMLHTLKCESVVTTKDIKS